MQSATILLSKIVPLQNTQTDISIAGNAEVHDAAISNSVIVENHDTDSLTSITAEHHNTNFLNIVISERHDTAV